MRKRIGWIIVFVVLLMTPLTARAYEVLSVRQQYEEYEARFAEIETFADVEQKGFRIIEDQMFQEVFESYGEEPLTFFAALEKKYNRMAVFLMDAAGNIVYKTNQLETNNRVLGEMKQPTREIAAVSFIDMNNDNRKDILLITRCFSKVILRQMMKLLLPICVTKKHF